MVYGCLCDNNKYINKKNIENIIWEGYIKMILVKIKLYNYDIIVK